MKIHCPESAFEIGLLAMAVAVLLGCAPSGPIAPPGQITLSYKDKSDSRYFFVLDNHSAQAIYLRGTKGFWTGAVPSHSLTCTGSASSETEAENYIQGDSIFSILPEERLRLSIDKGGSLARHKGGVCYVQLLSENHALIRSDEFEP